MTDLDTRLPEFTSSVRGYDRRQVDEYIQRLQQITAEAEERARVAEAMQEDSGHADIGPRVAQIFELATAEARELRQQAREEASELIGDARRDAREIVQDANETAEQRADEALRAHGESMAEFAREEERARSRVEELDARREAVLGELRRLHDALGLASGVVTPQLGDGAVGAADGSPDGTADMMTTEQTQIIRAAGNEEALTAELPAARS